MSIQIRKISVAIILATSILAGCNSTNSLENTINFKSDQGTQNNIKSLTQVVTRNQGSAEAFNVRGAAYGRAGLANEALRDFSTAIRLDPQYFQAYANRALINRQTNKPAAAVKDYSAALRINPRYDAAYIGRGNVYRVAGRNKEALLDFERAIQLGSSNPRAYHARGLVLQSSGRHDQAIEDFTTAISIDSTPAQPYSGRAVSYLALNDTYNALLDANRAIDIDSKIAEAWLTKALVLERQGNKIEARHAFGVAAQINPKMREAAKGLGRVRL